MKIQELLSELGAHIGLPDVRLDDSGVCRLSFNDDLHVDLERAEDEFTLHLHTVLGVIPPEGKKAFYIQLLNGNYLGSETAGAALCLDKSEGQVLLSRTVLAEHVDVEAFAELLSDFVRAASDWRTRLETLCQNGPPAQDDVSSVAGFMRV